MTGTAPLPRHTLPADAFDALSAGGGDRPTIAVLRSAQLSRRLLQLRAVRDLAAGTAHAGQVRAAYDLLAQAQRTRPEAVTSALLRPQVGSWAARTLRRLRTARPDPAALAADLRHLGAIAAAALVAAGDDFSAEVPLRGARLVLPGIGALLLDGAAGGTGLLRRTGGALVLRSSGRTTALPGDLSAEAPHWLPLRRLAAVCDGERLELSIEDIDPYRDGHGLAVADRLPHDALRRWRRKLADAWELLVRHHPGYAQGIAAGLRELVPLAAAPDGRDRSATAGDSFGSTALSEPADGTALAVALLHEFQHTKLSALLDLVALHDHPAGNRLYAPWRDDPRPLAGLLQGVYAHAGVVDFWRTQRTLVQGPAARYADFQYARWYRPTCEAARAVADSGLLNAYGRRFVAGLRRRLAELDAPVPEQAGRLAEDAAADHEVTWRLRHLRPDPGAVEELAERWLERRPPAARVPVSVAPDPDGTVLGGRIELLAGLLERPGSPPPGAEPLSVPDRALLAGDHRAAESGYLRLIAADPSLTSAWAGLAVARGRGRSAADPLRTRPEVVAGLYRRLRERGRPAEPARLADWLSAPADAPE
ncbi:HEXXH motif domain-containing protein [Allonocardiopsis opalescens]|uniref:HEXXH motif-containing protein n=1 Tax=Allonocardiopsis opalescens TaxID=1144618 RepID=A0A2T0QFJ8_9ACTN|nr:HEXXH motif domain-containing protein [Allonocardiopsis opalescens]PRY02699.1 HEXXH motif-containing protein [Allonocardiopsis opalescens]